MSYTQPSSFAVAVVRTGCHAGIWRHQQSGEGATHSNEREQLAQGRSMGHRSRQSPYFQNQETNQHQDNRREGYERVLEYEARRVALKIKPFHVGTSMTVHLNHILPKGGLGLGNSRVILAWEKV